MKWLDLSHPLASGMPVYPGDEPVEIRQTRWLAEHHFNNFVSVYGQHVGTHVDGPMHMTDAPEFIGTVSPERFCGNAVVIDVRGLRCVLPEHVPQSRLFPGCTVLFCTGWDAVYGTDAYYAEHPVLSEALAERLVAAGVKLVGVDLPSPDQAPFRVHKQLLSSGVLIVENLRGLEALLHREHIRFFAFPLALRADSSPVRAVAEVED